MPVMPLDAICTVSIKNNKQVAVLEASIDFEAPDETEVDENKVSNIIKKHFNNFAKKDSPRSYAINSWEIQDEDEGSFLDINFIIYGIMDDMNWCSIRLDMMGLSQEDFDGADVDMRLRQWMSEFFDFAKSEGVIVDVIDIS